jgi:hypothetical protein
MTYRAAATKALFNSIPKDTFLRAKKWFQEHPEEPYCYWAKDDFIAIKDKNNQVILSKYPEIEDIDDHTIVQWDPLSDTVFLSKFCPKLRQGIREMVDAEYMSNDVEGYHWVIMPDGDNFKVLIYENKKNM